MSLSIDLICPIFYFSNFDEIRKDLAKASDTLL